MMPHFTSAVSFLVLSRGVWTSTRCGVVRNGGNLAETLVLDIVDREGHSTGFAGTATLHALDCSTYIVAAAVVGEVEAVQPMAPFAFTAAHERESKNLRTIS